MKIQFLGATQTVTGSKYLIRTPHTNVLVDCGLFQGYKELRLRNWAPLPFDPKTLDHVLLTHAHIDHSGYLPLLVKQGFRGSILCSQATQDLCRILLPDSGYLQEEEARYANEKGHTRHRPALPLYTQLDAIECLKQFQTVAWDEPFKLHEDISACFHYAGHILGASLIRLVHQDVSVLFSGDLGRPHDPLMNPPKAPPESDYLVIEATYGDRLHEKKDPKQPLQDVINRTVKRGGMILIPAFAVGRTQTLLYYIQQLKQQNAIPDIPVFVDSPMATSATELFSRHATENRLSPQQCLDVCHVAHYVQSVEESIALDQETKPMILISASGMATGGRIVHHIKHRIADARNTLLFTGFQAGGTRGDRLVRGEKEIKLFGQMLPVNAEIVQLENASAHVDHEEMIAWLKQLKHPPKKIFITHGGKESAEALKQEIQQTFHWTCCVPSYLDEATLRA